MPRYYIVGTLPGEGAPQINNFFVSLTPEQNVLPLPVRDFSEQPRRGPHARSGNSFPELKPRDQEKAPTCFLAQAVPPGRAPDSRV